MRRLFAALGLLAALSLPALALAQDGADPTGDRATTFQAAEPGAQTENVPGGTLLVVAYGVAWICVFGYAVSLGMRQAKTAKDLERLRQDLAARRDDEG